MLSKHDRTDIFIESLDEGNTPFLDELEREALNADVPIIRRSMQRFLKLMLKITKPEKILEIGTAVGFSAILMAQYTNDECRITTIEKYEKRIPLAKANFKKSGFDEKITLIEGDARDVLSQMAESGMEFDFIFMDAAKAQYIVFLPDVIKILKSGGVLITDNVLQDDTVIQSKYTVTRRDRTIHKRMREYLTELMRNDELTTDIIDIGDGVAVSVKN